MNPPDRSDSPIVDEVRARANSISERYGHDLRKYAKDLTAKYMGEWLDEGYFVYLSGDSTLSAINQDAKFGGPFARINVAKLEAAKLRSPSLRNIFARYADCMLAQIFQSTACNAIHSIEQRTAKWIISAMERTDGDNIVPLTHEQLATLLGVGRSYASRVMQTFKTQGVLETRRGAIVVRNPEALRLHACLCNEAVKNHFEEVLRGVYPDPEKDN